MLRVLFPNQVIRADDLGSTMVDVVVRGTAEREEVGRAIIHVAPALRNCVRSLTAPRGLDHAW